MTMRVKLIYREILYETQYYNKTSRYGHRYNPRWSHKSVISVLSEIGGTLIEVPYTFGISTTEIIHKINAQPTIQTE